MKDMINNTSINNSSIPQNTGQSPVGIIQRHLLKDSQFKVIDTKFPPVAGFGNQLNIEDAEASQYVQGLKFIVRDEKGRLSQQTYAQIRKEEAVGAVNMRQTTANIVGIVADGGVYGVKDLGSLPVIGVKNEAVFNRNATGPENFFTDPKGGNTLKGAILTKLN
jgi:hypothetical protein